MDRRNILVAAEEVVRQISGSVLSNGDHSNRSCAMEGFLIEGGRAIPPSVQPNSKRYEEPCSVVLAPASKNAPAIG